MKRAFITLIIVGFAVLVPSGTVYAIDPPDGFQIIDASVYRNVSETGDVAVIFHGKINYDSYNGTYPTTPASSSILLRLIADNGTVLAAAAPYVYSPFETNGYGDFVSGFYFDAASAPTWGAVHNINITGLPAYYSPVPTPVNYPLQASDYTTSSDQDDNRDAMYIEVIRLCDVFISIYTDVPLKSTTDVGTVLSAYGEAYFKSAIPGLENMCPQLFYVQVYTPTAIETVPYTTDLADTMAAHTTGSDFERGMDRIGDYIGVAGSFVVGILVFIGTLAICIMTMRKGWGIEPGVVLSSLGVILAAVLIGDWIFNLMMIVSLVAAIALMWILALRRA